MTAHDLAHAEARYRAVELRSPEGEIEASFVPRAGMVGWSLRHRGDELLAHPVSLESYVETGHPTGIPLLHPWANRLASPEYEIAGRRVKLELSAANVHTDPGGLPIHGLAAGWPHWEVLEQRRSWLKAQLDYGAWPELMAGFPFPHLLELTVELYEDRMAIDTELVPTGEVPVPVAFGFHPYLRVPGLQRERWLLELPVTSRMELDEHMLPTGRSEPERIPPAPLGDRTFDDAFDGLADPPEFAVSGAGRRVSLLFAEGYRFAQVYAPPGSDFICFEPMTAPVNPFASDRTRLAEPGTRYAARFEIAVRAVDR
jgi:galactose mutarotase-like enzyme